MILRTTIEVSFTKEEYEKQKRFNGEPRIYGPCDAIDCLGIKCDVCPLRRLTRAETLEYIKTHLEESEEE